MYREMFKAYTYGEVRGIKSKGSTVWVYTLVSISGYFCYYVVVVVVNMFKRVCIWWSFVLIWKGNNTMFVCIYVCMYVCVCSMCGVENANHYKKIVFLCFCFVW